MKKINTKQELKNLKDEPLKTEDGEVLTLGYALATVLSAKVKNPYLGYVLAKKLSTNDEVDLKAEEIVFIKEAVKENGESKGYGYTSLVAGQIIDILEN